MKSKTCFWCGDVHDDGMEHDDSRNYRWHCWHRPVNLFHSYLQRLEMR